jgi:exopolyphosphatase / guanosine-5'-triphosphate,3'-diphosphate pyrophosphatase
MRIAILDLGTNTFNLLIVETETGNSATKILLSRKEPVRLGAKGINKGKITRKAFERGLAAIENHVKYIQAHMVDQVYAFATSAIRSAGNGLEFVRVVYDRFNIGIQVISGNKEAELIYLGVKQAIDMGQKKHLIVDIGGGSNELIIADSDKIYWKKSFPLGMARLLNKFKPSDPIESDVIEALESHFSEMLCSFFQAAEIHKPDILIGSSGSFDTFRALLEAMKGSEPTDGGGLYYKFTTSDFLVLHQRLVRSTAEERLQMEGMEPMRVEMIVIAAIFVNFIVRKLNIGLLIQSDYALKEGAVIEILKQPVPSLQQEN